MNTPKTLPSDTQRWKALLSRFTPRRGNGSLFPLIRRRPKEYIPSNLYHHINETPLCVFIDCLCDHNYRALIKFGRASQDSLAKAWEMIYTEYSDQSGNPTSKLLISLYKDIAYHDAKLRAVGLCLKVLQHAPDQPCINVLKGYGYDYPFDITRPEEYAHSLETIATRTGSILIILQLKRAEYERESKKVEGKPMTRERFYDLLAVLFEHYHSRIDPKEVTVAEFVSYRKRYEMEMIALQRQSEKTLKRGK